MDAEIIKIVGQVAGIGGIAFGVLLLIFRDVIQKKIFPMLTKEQAYQIIRLIVVLTFSIAALGIGAWVYVQKHKLPAPSETTVLWSKNWRTLNDPIPRMGSSDGYSATNREQLLEILRALDLATAPDLSAMRTMLIQEVESATSRPQDSTYNIVVPQGFDTKFQSLKRGVRDRAISAGVSTIDLR